MEHILQPIGKAEPEFAALVAIDWADQKHYWSLKVVGQEGLQRGTLDHTPEAVEVWMMELHLRFGGRPRSTQRPWPNSAKLGTPRAARAIPAMRICCWRF